MMHIVHRLVAGLYFGLFTILFRGVFRTQISGVDRVPRTGGLLLVANHISLVDPPLIGCVTPRRVEFMAMAELFRHPVLAFFSRAIGAFPVERTRPDQSAVREAVRRLRAGNCVGIFPEAGIRRTEKSVLAGHAQFSMGASMIALHGQAPILPVIVRDTRMPYDWRNWLPFGRGRHSRVTMRVTFGQPFCLWIPPHLSLRERRRLAHELVRDQLLKTVALD
jgi:1-acyl-sn-glycerol-3-phosphate acyltransferase